MSKTKIKSSRSNRNNKESSQKHLYCHDLPNYFLKKAGCAQCDNAVCSVTCSPITHGQPNLHPKKIEKAPVVESLSDVSIGSVCFENLQNSCNLDAKQVFIKAVIKMTTWPTAMFDDSFWTTTRKAHKKSPPKIMEAKEIPSRSKSFHPFFAEKRHPFLGRFPGV